METIVKRAEKVIKDFKGNKEKVYNHFINQSNIANSGIFSFFGMDAEKYAKECKQCAEYIKSIM